MLISVSMHVFIDLQLCSMHVFIDLQLWLKWLLSTWLVCPLLCSSHLGILCLGALHTALKWFTLLHSPHIKPYAGHLLVVAWSTLSSDSCSHCLSIGLPCPSYLHHACFSCFASIRTCSLVHCLICLLLWLHWLFSFAHLHHQGHI